MRLPLASTYIKFAGREAPLIRTGRFGAGQRGNCWGMIQLKCKHAHHILWPRRRCAGGTPCTDRLDRCSEMPVQRPQIEAQLSCSLKFHSGLLALGPHACLLHMTAGAAAKQGSAARRGGAADAVYVCAAELKWPSGARGNLCHFTGVVVCLSRDFHAWHKFSGAGRPAPPEEAL